MIKSECRAACLIGASLLGSGCIAPKKVAPVGASVTAVAARGDAWTGVATAADRNRINRTALAWQTGLAEARARGFREQIRAEGKSLVFGGGLARPAPTPGSYSCRLVTLGRSAKRGPAFVKFKPFFCYVDVEGDLFTIVKQTGSERPAGHLWADQIPTRLIFLGSLALGNEEEARAYGADPRRDVAGVFERIAPFVWRLVIPFPQDGTKLQVFELTPVAEQPKG
ncbi:MAG: DUF4893 domain-containing protein [Pseudomonadota bacterium]|nr:DUF4893 domain-containing protein [Pseudomonadota bacterium]